VPRYDADWPNDVCGKVRCNALGLAFHMLQATHFHELFEKSCASFL
jgi:hypothetical protein